MLTVAEQNTTLYKSGGDDNPTKQYRLEIVLVADAFTQKFHGIQSLLQAN